MGSTFEPNAIVVHLNNLNQVRVLPEPLVNSPFDLVGTLLLGPWYGDLAHFVWIDGGLEKDAEIGLKDMFCVGG